MSDTPSSGSAAPQAAHIEDPVLILAKLPCRLKWDKAAMFRADQAGLFDGNDESVLGFARACKYVWAMLPPDRRNAFKDPESIAPHLPALIEVRKHINNALALAGEEMDPKNVVGLMSGPSS